MLKKILIGFAAVIAVFLVVVAMQPAAFHIERSATVTAPPATVFPLIADFHQWKGWSPWEKLDPNMTTTFTGEAGQPGSSYAWKGNSDVGAGKMTIEQASAPQTVKIKLEFTEPFAATNITTFTLAPEGTGTKVTWAMDGENNFMAKAFGLFADMDKMIGTDFEKGLGAMKTMAEGSAPTVTPAGASR